MPAGTKEHLFKFLCNFPINIFKSFKAYLKVKPDVIIATGRIRLYQSVTLRNYLAKK